MVQSTVYRAWSAYYLTKVAPDHLDGAAGSLEVVASEKARLGRYVSRGGFMVVSGEDPGSRLIPRDGWPARVLTFGCCKDMAGLDAGYSCVVSSESGTEFVLRLGDRSGQCRLQTFGEFQAANATAAALVAHGLGFSLEEVIEAVSQVPPLPRRFAIHRFTRGLTLIDDTFSASVDAVESGLRNAARLAGDRRKVALLSGIAQLGERSAEYHREVGRFAAECGFDEVVFVASDERTAFMREGALAAGLDPCKIGSVQRWSRISATLRDRARPATLIYCKTSQFLWTGPQVDAFVDMLPGLGFEILPEG
jgi:UDP-N-acetylmuramoyl-tripeptide--D-alanyl-D-alanine ligase